MQKSIFSAILFATFALGSATASAQSLIESVATEVVYTSDLYSNTSGGADTGTRYLQNLDLAASIDVEQFFGGGKGELFVYVIYDDNTTLSDLVGDLQVASNIDADQGWRLYEAWWDLPLTENLGLRTGLFDLNSEFDAIETAGYFNNSSHGIGADYSQSGQNAPSIFPSTSAAIRLAWSPQESMILRYALLDGVPGDPADAEAFADSKIRDGEGVLHALELENTLDSGIRTAVGLWRYSSEFEKINEFAGVTPISDSGNQGVYAFVDAPVYQSDNGLWVNAFARYGIANQDFNQLSSYLGFGAVAGGLISSRPEDTLGLAVATAFNGDDYKTLNGGLVDDHETAIELTYSAQLTDKFRIQPDIQYIINPGADPSLDNALVIGVRFELAWASP